MTYQEHLGSAGRPTTAADSKNAYSSVQPCQAHPLTQFDSEPSVRGGFCHQQIQAASTAAGPQWAPCITDQSSAVQALAAPVSKGPGKRIWLLTAADVGRHPRPHNMHVPSCSIKGGGPLLARLQMHCCLASVPSALRQVFSHPILATYLLCCPWLQLRLSTDRAGCAIQAANTKSLEEHACVSCHACTLQMIGICEILHQNS